MTRPALLARNLGWAARSFSPNARQLAGQERKPLGRPSHRRRPRRPTQSGSPGRGRLPLGPRRKDACAIAVAEQRNRRVPAQSLRQGEVRQPERENLDVDARGASVSSFIAAALGAHGRRERMFGAGHDVPQGGGEAVETRGVRQSDKIGRDSQGRGVEPHWAGREEAPQPMNAPGGAGLRVPGARSQDVRRRAGAAVSSRAAPCRAGGGGSQSEALAQRAGERRIEAKNLIQQSEPGAGEEGRGPRGADGGFSAAAPRAESLVPTGVGRRDTRRDRRRDRRRGRRRRRRRIGGGVSSSKASAESNRTMV